MEVPWELVDKPLQSPAENRIPPPHHFPNSIKALGSRLEGAGPAVGAVAASSLPILPRRRGRYVQPWRSLPDAWASAPNGAPSRTLSTGATRGEASGAPQGATSPARLDLRRLSRDLSAANERRTRTPGAPGEEPRAAPAVPPTPPAVSSHPRGREGSRHLHPDPTRVGSGARGRRQLLPPSPGSPGLVAPRDGRGPVGHIEGPAAAPLLTWRSLGPGWGIRRVCASPRARCAPARRRPPAPALAAALALHGARGWPGPREACPVGGGSSGSRSSPMAPRLPPPRVRAPFLCGRPFPSARLDRPNWFLRSRVVPLVSF